VLPADHYVREEKVLRQSLLAALDRVRHGDGRPVLLGLEPDEVDAELGYVLPGEPEPLGSYSVSASSRSRPIRSLRSSSRQAGCGIPSSSPALRLG
jgi:mannose-1-phosphate guanylyltransferase